MLSNSIISFISLTDWFKFSTIKNCINSSFRHIKNLDNWNNLHFLYYERCLPVLSSGCSRVGSLVDAHLSMSCSALAGLLADCPAVRWPPAAAMLSADIGLLLLVLRLCCCLRYLRHHRWLYLGCKFIGWRLFPQKQLWCFTLRFCWKG